jgi:hypothetical protein
VRQGLRCPAFLARRRQLTFAGVMLFSLPKGFKSRQGRSSDFFAQRAPEGGRPSPLGRKPVSGHPRV